MSFNVIYWTQEYEKYSKYLNKGSVDAYREKKEAEEKLKEKDDERSGGGGGCGGGSEEDEKASHKKRKKEKREKNRDRDGEEKHYEQNGEPSSASKKADVVVAEDGIASLWPYLRVRIVSRSFKGGAYYSSKGDLIPVVRRSCVYNCFKIDISMNIDYSNG